MDENGAVDEVGAEDEAGEADDAVGEQLRIRRSSRSNRWGSNRRTNWRSSWRSNARSSRQPERSLSRRSSWRSNRRCEFATQPYYPAPNAQHMQHTRPERGEIGFHKRVDMQLRGWWPRVHKRWSGWWGVQRPALKPARQVELLPRAGHLAVPAPPRAPYGRPTMLLQNPRQGRLSCPTASTLRLPASSKSLRCSFASLQRAVLQRLRCGSLYPANACAARLRCSPIQHSAPALVVSDCCRLPRNGQVVQPPGNSAHALLHNGNSAHALPRRLGKTVSPALPCVVCAPRHSGM